MSDINDVLAAVKMITELTDVPSKIPPEVVSDHSFRIGSKYLIRTVTMMYTGKLVKVTATDIQLDDAAWIADSGRYSNALHTGELSEVEPYPSECWVSRAAIVDFSYWQHDLPREVK